MEQQKNNIILIGMMGAGKTSVGKAVAVGLCADFFDVDQMYEEQFGLIEETFLAHGEDVFRERESCLLDGLRSCRGAVIATGGGSVLSNKFSMLKKSGTVIWLTAPAGVLFARLSADSKKRPLNKGEKQIAKILEDREKSYTQAADIVVDTEDKTLLEVAEEIVGKIERLG